MKFLALVLPLVTVNPAAATESFSQNPNWSAWLGCWQAEGAPANQLVCIAPADGGVKMTTLIDGAVRAESRIVADGSVRPVQSVGCSGNESAKWSSDRRRVFLESDVACGSSGRRTVRGMFAFVAPDAWISVQSATDGDSVATRVVRFTAVEPRSVPASAASFAGRGSFNDVLLDVDETDVNEAVAQIGAEAAQEWMRSAGEPFELGYQGQDGGNGSALEQVGRMSNPVAVREVVRVVERPVYVRDYYYDRYYYDPFYWHYSPWGYHYRGWYWHRPYVHVHFPIVVFRNSHYRRDYWRYDYDRNRRDRYDYNRRDRDRDDDWRNRDDSRGRVTRAGYSSGRERSVEPNRERTVEPTRERTVETNRARSAVPRSTTPQRSTPQVSRGSGTTSRASAPPQRSSGSSRGTVTRTARARSSRD